MQPGSRAVDQGDRDRRPPSARTFIEDARRRQIVDAAIETIAELGYEKASFARIAARAGISASLISYHFASKGDLIASVAGTVDAELDDALTEATGRAESHTEAVRCFVEGFVRYADTHHSAMIALWQLTRGVPAAERDGIPALGDGHGTSEWRQLIEEAQTGGELTGIDARTAAALVMGVLYAVPGQLLSRSDLDVDVFAAQVGDFVVNALTRHDHGEPR